MMVTVKWLVPRGQRRSPRPRDVTGTMAAVATTVQQRYCRSFGSTGHTAAPTSSSSSSSSSSTTAATGPQLYVWGTDTKGSLLRNPAMQGSSSVTKIDVPTRIDNVHSLLSSAVDVEGEDGTSGAGGDVDRDRGGTTIRQIVCGATDTAIILSDGSCWVCGENRQGQLGVGHAQPVTRPTRVALPRYNDDNDNDGNRREKEVAQVSLGHQMGAYVDADGDLYTCGFGGSVMSGFGLLGHGDTVAASTTTAAADGTGTGASVYAPKLVESIVEDGCYAKQVAVSESHITCLTTEGEVLTTGSGSYGRLGNFDTVDQLYFEPVEILTAGVAEIAGGKSFTLALSSDGVVYGWGRNHKGQLGTGLGLAVDMYAMQAIPEPIEADELLGRRVVKIAAGAGHAACITQGGELFYWGMSLYLEPVRVAELLHTKIVDVVCGLDYTLAVDEEGRMYSFGNGGTGVLGQGSIKNLNQPAVMEAFEGNKVVQVSAGWKHAACLVEDA